MRARPETWKVPRSLFPRRLFPLLLVACGGAAERGAEGNRSPAAAGSAGTSAAGAGATSGSAGAPSSDGASSADCVSAFQNSDNTNTQRITAEVLELASAAPAASLLQLGIALVDPTYDFSALNVAEREAQLAPYQEPIVELVNKRGGQVVSRSWLINYMDVRLPARHVPEAFCWPEVVSLEMETRYWDAVVPPWDPSTVGLQECPIIDGACPAHCNAIEGRRFDAARACLTSPAGILACDRGLGTTTADIKCRANELTGELFQFGGVGPNEPQFSNWRVCTETEYSAAISAPSCE